jgi:hypothetical protein
MGAILHALRRAIFSQRTPAPVCERGRPSERHTWLIPGLFLATMGTRSAMNNSESPTMGPWTVHLAIHALIAERHHQGRWRSLERHHQGRWRSLMALRLKPHTT